MNTWRCVGPLLLCVSQVVGQWAYPPTKTVDSADTYWGRTYRDPYRWLEDLKSKETQDWFKAQTALSTSLLDRIPGRDSLIHEWTELDKLKQASYSDFAFEGGRLFYRKTRGGENVGKLYYREGWNGEEKLLFDPVTYRPGVKITIQNILPDLQGRRVALGLSSGGAEITEIHILNVDNRKFLSDSMYPSWFGPEAWSLDGSYLLYFSQKTADNTSKEFELHTKTKLHKIGTDPGSDIDFFSDESYPNLGIGANELPFAVIDESYPEIVCSYAANVQNEFRMWYAPMNEFGSPKIKWKVLCDASDSLVRGLQFYGGRVYSVTLKGASNYKVVSTSLENPDWSHASVVVPEAKDVIQTLVKGRDYMMILYSNGITGRIVQYDFVHAVASEVALPLSGTVDVYCPDVHSNSFLIHLTAWTTPSRWYAYDADNGTMSVSPFNVDVRYPGFEDLVADEVEVPGHDGTQIPLSIVYRKGLKKDGNNSCILEGYGSYGYSTSPYFSLMRSPARRNVVFAYAHVRGGGEKGEMWYRAGYKATKPNTWKDFISCAEYLVKNGYTSREKLAGTGTSAGGILISRAITERPDLFGAAVCNVGIANAMRFEFMANGPANVPEFGSVRDSAGCLALYEMDGVQHVRDGIRYPATLCVDGWNDPRVEPCQPGKFAASLQHSSTSGKPVLMLINYDNGHFTEEKEVTFRDFANQCAFLLWQTGHPDFQPSK